MPLNFFSRRRPYRHVSLWAGWWINLQFFWHTHNKGPWVAAVILVSLATFLGGAMYMMDANQLEKRELACLALNVYYEARGESAAGMFAVAEGNIDPGLFACPHHNRGGRVV